MLLLTSLLIGQVGRGLVDAKTKVSLPEAQAGLLQAQEIVKGGRTQNVVQSRLQAAALALSQRGRSGDQYSIVLVSASGEDKAFASAGASLGDVPPVLVRALSQGRPASYTFGKVHGVDTLVVGATLSTDLGDYRLFHLFPLTGETATFALVRRTVLVASLLLVLLLVLIAYLVSRQVVLPVRMAARTAERLAGGRLEERMEVHGEDELARLATTFNTMAEALQTQIRQLEHLSRVQQGFVSDVTHELRTPLTTVRMAADVLHDAREDFPAAAARSAELLQAELERFESLLAELLEISRYDAGAASLDAELLDVVPVVTRVLEAAGSLAARKGSELVLVAPGPAVAEVDQVRVARIVRNLVVNALEHGEGRPVEVHVADGGSSVTVLVRDYGVGLRPGDPARVFTRFWRGDPSRARTTGGTGLGLAIALEDARLHGGALQAWGEPGRGSVFRLRLPRVVGGPLGPSPLPLVPADAASPAGPR